MRISFVFPRFGDLGHCWVSVPFPGAKVLPCLFSCLSTQCRGSASQEGFLSHLGAGPCPGTDFSCGKKGISNLQKCLLTSIDEKGSLDGQFKLVKGQHRVWWIPSTGCHPLAHTRYFALELFSPSHYWLWTVHAFKCWSKCSWVSLSPEGKLLHSCPFQIILILLLSSIYRASKFPKEPPVGWNIPTVSA